MVRSIALVAFVAAAVASAAACGTGTNSSPASPTTVLGTITVLTVSGTPPAIGSASQFKATATLLNGTLQDVTHSVTWQTSDANAATVTPAGVVNGLAPGSLTITATLGSMSAMDQITIRD